MQALARRPTPLQTVAVVTTACACGVSGLVANSSPSWSVHSVLLAFLLLVALTAAKNFSIHVRVGTKIDVSSVVLYLIAALLPPGLAAIIVGLGMLAGDLSMRHKTRNGISGILIQASRWMLIMLVAAGLIHVPTGSEPMAFGLLVGGGVLLWSGDILTAPLVFTTIFGDPPLLVIGTLVKDVGAAEAAQYLIGLMAAMEATRQLWAVPLFLLPTTLAYLTFKNSKEMRVGTQDILVSMADMVDMRDPYTGGHSRRVTDLTARILKELGKQGPEVDLIVSAARVHDIGKIAVPDGILNKPGKLTAEEWAIMTTHPERGEELLRRYPDFQRGAEIVRHHHEAWDGSGYPDRLRARDIPFGARVIAVADSWDAMTSDRPYRIGMSPDRAAAILEEGRGQQWDAEIVDAFLLALADEINRPVKPVLHLVPSGADETVATA